MTNVPVDQVKVGPRFRHDAGDIDGLVNSIVDVGLIHPIVVDKDLNLVAGYRRLMAYKYLLWKSIPATVIDADDPKLIEVHENTQRKPFTFEEVVAVKRYLEPKLRASAAERMKAGEPCEDSSGGLTRDVISSVVGVSHDTIKKMEAIVDYGNESLKDDVRTGKLSVNAAYNRFIPVTPSDPLGIERQSLNIVRKKVAQIKDVTKYASMISLNMRHVVVADFMEAIDTLNSIIEAFGPECEEKARRLHEKRPPPIKSHS